MEKGSTRVSRWRVAAAGLLLLVLAARQLPAQEFEAALAQARSIRHFLVVVMVGGAEQDEAWIREQMGRREWTEGLRPHVQVVVRADRNPSVATRFAAVAFPQFIVLDTDGREVGRVQGKQAASSLAERIRRIVEAAERFPGEDLLLQRSADDLEALFWVGTYRWNRGDRYLALESFRRILQLSDAKGLQHGDGGSDPTGRTAAARVQLVEDDIISSALRYVAQDEMDCGNFAAAEAYFRRALEITRDADTRCTAAYGLSMSMRRQGRTEEAIRLLESYVAGAPGSHVSGQILFTLGALHLEIGDRAGAREHFEACAARFPDTLYGLRSRRHLRPESLEGPAPGITLSFTGSPGSRAGTSRHLPGELD